MTATTRTATVIRHVHFEDLGSIAPVLEARGYHIRYLQAGTDPLDTLDPLAPDLLVVLGGPIGVYETDDYPVIAQETALVARRLAAGRPTLGICLGAQVMAAALGAKVYPGPAKEIGWAPITLTEAGRNSPLAPLAEDGGMVLHWHGDTFDLPPGAELLASTPLCRHQAYRIGATALAFQFHPEALAARFEEWLIGHAAEIAGAKLSPSTLRADTARWGESLERRAQRCFGAWMEGV